MINDGFLSKGKLTLGNMPMKGNMKKKLWLAIIILVLITAVMFVFCI